MTIKSIAKQTATIIRPLLSDIASRAVSIWAVVADAATDMNTKETGELKSELIASVGGYESLLTRAVAIGRFMNEAKLSESYMSKAYKVLGERIIGNLAQQKTEATEVKSAFDWAIDSKLLNTRNISLFKSDWRNEGLKVAQSNLVKASKETGNGNGNGNGNGKTESTEAKLERAEKNAEKATRKHNEVKEQLKKEQLQNVETKNRNAELVKLHNEVSALIGMAKDNKVSKVRLQGAILNLQAFVSETVIVADNTPIDRDAAKLERFNAKAKKAAAANKGIARKKAKEAAAAAAK